MYRYDRPLEITVLQVLNTTVPGQHVVNQLQTLIFWENVLRLEESSEQYNLNGRTIQCCTLYIKEHIAVSALRVVDDYDDLKEAIIGYRNYIDSKIVNVFGHRN